MPGVSMGWRVSVSALAVRGVVKAVLVMPAQIRVNVNHRTVPLTRAMVAVPAFLPESTFPLQEELAHWLEPHVGCSSAVESIDKSNAERFWRTGLALVMAYMYLTRCIERNRAERVIFAWQHRPTCGCSMLPPSVVEKRVAKVR